MKKRVLAALLVTMMTVGTVAGCGSNAKSDDSDKKASSESKSDDKKDSGKKVTVVTSGTGEPYSLISDDGKWTGIDAEMWDEIEKRTGWEVEVKQASFDAMWGELDTGRADVVANCLAVKEERTDKYNATIPYYGDSQCIIVNDDSDYKTSDDLKGKTVGCTNGQAAQTIIEDMAKEKGFTVKLYEDSAVGMNDLKLGQLYLNKGKWNGKQIIPESWAEASVTKKVDSIEGTYGYGYQLWMEERPGSFEYNGMLGQNVLIYPDVDMVIVTNAGNEELFQDNVMLNIIRKYFPVDWMPKETLPENLIAYAKLQELTERLAGKRLKNDQYYNSPLIIGKGGWKKNSSKYRVRERQTEIEKVQNQQIHLLTDLLDGTCYEMEQASVGLFPLVMQVMHNNMTDGISKINFYKRRTKELQQTLILCFQEGEESIELEMGWNQYIENKLSIHGETYLVAVKGELSSDVDDNPVLKVEIVYLEEAMRRKLYVTFVKDTSASKLITPEYIEIKWYESPGKALIMEGMESITTEVTKHPIYSRIRENGGIDLLHRLMEQTIEPVIKGRIIDSSEEAQQDTEVQHPEISGD